MSSKKMPDLAKLLGKKRIIKRPSAEEQRLALLAISAACGIPIKEPNRG